MNEIIDEINFMVWLCAVTFGAVLIIIVGVVVAAEQDNKRMREEDKKLLDELEKLSKRLDTINRILP